MSFGAYLLGCVTLTVAIWACVSIGIVGRRLLVPAWVGPPGWLVSGLLATAAAIWPALLLGTFGLLRGWAWLILVVIIAAMLWRFQAVIQGRLEGRHGPSSDVPPQRDAPLLMNGIGLSVAAGAFGVFVAGAAVKLGTGMTVFDTNWYHGPLSVAMAKTGDTLALHHVAPAFLTWFYPQNSELIHTLGMQIFGNDLVSLALNLGWFAGCLLATWLIGRPYGAAPISLGGAALVLGSVTMADQAGEARNDIVGAFFVLAGLAVLVNAAAGGRRITLGPGLIVGLAAGMAAGTKINFVPAAVVLAGAVLWLAGTGDRRRVIAGTLVATVLGGGYWYLRNLIQSGNPLPWIRELGPFTLPGPNQEIGGREAGSVLGYLGNVDVIRDWFFPGLHEALGPGWVIIFLLALIGPAICLSRRLDPARRVGAGVALALVFAWIAAPTSASGNPGVPGGFVTGLRYLAPALMAGMALLGSGLGARSPGVRWLTMGLLVLLAPFTIAPAGPLPNWHYWALAVMAAGIFWVLTAGAVATGRALRNRPRPPIRAGRRLLVATVASAVVIVALAGQPVQRYYFQHRYTTADYVTPGLAASFAWARGIDGARIGTTASRQYPYFGVMLGNEVGAIGTRQPHGGFVTPKDCRTFRTAVNRGNYRYLITALDRLNSARQYPFAAAWAGRDPATRMILRGPGAVVFRLTGRLNPDTCPRSPYLAPARPDGSRDRADRPG